MYCDFSKTIHGLFGLIKTLTKQYSLSIEFGVTMSVYRSIKKTVKAQKVNMGGHILDQALPLAEVDQIDPFILLHHAVFEYQLNGNPENLGIGPNPHRGFSPVTFIFRGDVHHRDSLGNSSVVTAGGTQWMNAGSGIIHSERPSIKIAKEGGVQEIIQLWINNPSSLKMSEPDYQPIQVQEIPEIISDDDKMSIKIVAGKFNNISGPVKPMSPLVALRIDAESGGEYEFSFPSNYNLFIYQLDSRLLLNEQSEAHAKDLSWFDNDGDRIKVKALEKTRFILMAGEPLNEPIASHGPFVMNNRAEILTAMNDYQSGKMGSLVENWSQN